MKKQTKRSMILFASLLASAAVCFALPSVKANAETEGENAPAYGFYLEDGASVRADNEYVGISYLTHITTEYYNKLKSTYAATENVTFSLKTKIAPVGVVTDSACSWDLTDAVFANKTEEDFRAILNYSNLLETAGLSEAEIKAELQEALALEVQASSYIEVKSGEEVIDTIDTETAGEEDTVRCMRAIAAAAMYSDEETAETKQTLSTSYLGKNKTGENEATLYYETSESTALSATVFSEYTAAYIDMKNITSNSAFGATELSGIELGTKGDAFVFDDENNYKKIPFQYVTKAIEKAKDLKVFTITADVDATDTKTIDGYYVLTGNLDATSQTAEHHAGLDSGNFAYNKSTQAGFVGTFDGNGYTLSANVDTYGLFGALADNAVIKDVVLNLHATATTYKSRGSAMLAVRSNASIDAPATIENVYVKMNDERTTKDYNVSLFRYGQHPNDTSRGFKAVKMVNLVVENVNCEYAKADDGVKYAMAGGLIFLEDTISYASDFNNNTSNVYILADDGTPLSITAKPTANQYVYTAQFKRTENSICFKNFSYISALSNATNLAWTYDATSGRLTVK